MAGLNCGASAAAAWPLLAEGFDLLLTLDDAAAAAGVRLLRRIGLRAGECAGGTIAAPDSCLGPTCQPWRELLDIRAQSSVVLLLSEGDTFSGAASTAGVTAVDGQGDPGDEPGVRAQQITDAGRHISRRPDPAEGRQ